MLGSAVYTDPHCHKEGIHTGHYSLHYLLSPSPPLKYLASPQGHRNMGGRVGYQKLGKLVKLDHQGR
jgi:hypothetical protein